MRVATPFVHGTDVVRRCIHECVCTEYIVCAWRLPFVHGPALFEVVVLRDDGIKRHQYGEQLRQRLKYRRKVNVSKR